MSIWPEVFRRPAALALTFLLSAGFLAAQPVELPQGLAPQLTEVYRVLPVDGGIALDPKSPRNGIQRIEIRGQQVFVNGAQVPEAVLGSWLQQDAGPILELLAMASAERRELFDLPPDPSAAVVEAPEAAPGAESELESSVGAGTAENPSEDPVEASESRSTPAFEAPEVPVPPSPPETKERRSAAVHSEGRVVVGRSFTVEQDEIAEDVVVIGNNLRIEGEVLGDALAVGGTVAVNGRVSGDVAAIGGSVRLEEGARVHGNVVSVGGGVEREKGAQVFGEITEVALGTKILDFSRWGGMDWGFQPRVHSPFRGFWRTTGGLAKILCLAFFACLVFLVLQPQVRKAERIAAAEPWKAGLVGLAAILGFFAFFLPLLAVVCLVLTITIIGIPLVILLVFGVAVAAIALPLMGYATAALRVGGVLQTRFPGRLGGGVVLVLVGVLAIEISSFLAHVLGGAGWFLALPVFLFAFFGWLVRFSAWTVGLGAVLLSFQETRLGGAAGPTPPLPPLPRIPDDSPELDAIADRDVEVDEKDIHNLQDELENALWEHPEDPEEQSEGGLDDNPEGDLDDAPEAKPEG